MNAEEQAGLDQMCATIKALLENSPHQYKIAEELTTTILRTLGTGNLYVLGRNLPRRVHGGLSAFADGLIRGH